MNQSCICRAVQVIKSLQDPLEVANNLPGINDNVRERGPGQKCFKRRRKVDRDICQQELILPQTADKTDRLNHLCAAGNAWHGTDRGTDVQTDAQPERQTEGQTDGRTSTSLKALFTAHGLNWPETVDPVTRPVNWSCVSVMTYFSLTGYRQRSEN